jgi:uncharacterized phage infection (PIP) family protein YhgE
MPQSIKEQIAADLAKAKTEGGLRSDRIRAIFKQAIAAAAGEVRGGGSEIRHIARDAIATAFDQLKGSTAEEEDIRASIEGTVEGIVAPQQDAIAATQAQMQQLQEQIDQAEAALQNDVEAALDEIDSADRSRVGLSQPWVQKTTKAIRDTEGLDSLMEQYAKLKAQLAVLDANLAARYGERYDEVKTYLDQAKTWYDEARIRAEIKGVTPVQESLSDFETKLSELGVVAAKKERQIKRKLRELWESAKKITT